MNNAEMVGIQKVSEISINEKIKRQSKMKVGKDVNR